MAISPATEYPGQTTAPTPSYPFGGAQNITVPGDNTGTPWEERLLNDVFGFQQAMLTLAGATPTGLPETAISSQYLNSLLAVLETNAVKVEFTQDILTSTRPNIPTFLSVHFDANNVAESGAFWGYTGVTTVPNAGMEDYVNGVIYDGLGRQYAVEGAVLPQQYGALADGVTDDVVPVQNAMRRSTYKLTGTYGIGSTLSIQNTTTGVGINATFQALTDDFVVVEGIDKNNFEILVGLVVKGPGMGVGTGTGIRLFECWGYTIENPEVYALGSTIILDAVVVTPGGLAGHRGRQGRIVRPTTHTCKFGPQILGRAEYSLWENVQSTQCTQIGWTQEAGNTNVFGGNIQDNENGILLKEVNTTNANHGMFASVNVNHNIGYNLRCEDITLGHTFNGCHFYGDSPTAGTIEIIRCGGVNINGGIIDAKIVVDGDGVAGKDWNKISNNQIDLNFTVFDSTNDGREKMMVRDNFQVDGDAWGFNDRAFTSVATNALTSTQTLTTGVSETILFPSVQDDNRNQFNPVTGVFTAGQAQFLEVDFNVQITISAGVFSHGFLAIYVDGLALSVNAITAVDAGGLSLVSTGHLTKALVGGQTVEVRASVTATGTITIAADAATTFTLNTTE